MILEILLVEGGTSPKEKGEVCCGYFLKEMLVSVCGGRQVEEGDGQDLKKNIIKTWALSMRVLQ